MTPHEFIEKWRDTELRESQGAQEWFLDLCRLVGHPTPAEADKTGETFCFERGASIVGGGDGWADVWKRNYFAWEFKGRHKDLGAAHAQVAGYRDALQNPPLLIVSDFDRIHIHTVFTNTPAETHKIPIESLTEPPQLERLRAVFFDPDKLRPGRLDRRVTEAVAKDLAQVAQELRDRGLDPHDVARFLDRVVFCLFAEDVGLLPEKLMTDLLEQGRKEPASFPEVSATLFTKMAAGGFFGSKRVRHFNGHLFHDAATLELTAQELERLYQAARQDWSAIHPMIFGTLFERGMDPAKRSQLGLHYTSYADIETIVEPVVLEPLRSEWAAVREPVENLMSFGKKTRPENGKPPRGKASKKAREEAEILLERFLRRLESVKVLDPACGSGNFLFVTLQKLLDLEYEVLGFAQHLGIPVTPAKDAAVDPTQMYGIEISDYAAELAKMTVWIGYLQWRRQHGLPWGEDPVLKASGNIECRDAILDLSDPDEPREPEWPNADFIVSNPPFLGGSRLRRELGDAYVDALFSVYKDRVPHSSDLCCYWFEKSRAAIEGARVSRTGMLATQGIRGGANREVLKRIKASGDIFFAISDREWVLDGANVHVSMVGFDDGSDAVRSLDGEVVEEIGPSLSAGAAVFRAAALPRMQGICFMGPSPKARFDISKAMALDLLSAEGNPTGRANSDVVRPVNSAVDLAGRPRHMWTIDFGQLPIEMASHYEQPFEHVSQHVRPQREGNPRQTNRSWWQYERPRVELRHALTGVDRCLVTPGVAKHRLFVWRPTFVLCNQGTLVFARSEDYFFGVLHSRVHEVWARAQGTQLRERESGFRYTPTTCFETFPFPWPPGEEPEGDPRVEAIAEAARELNTLRERWLNPPEWTREEVLEFPGSTDGPWTHYVQDPDDHGIGTVRWPRLVPKDPECAEELQKRTLTNLYNDRPAWLTHAHATLDTAVFAAYGWTDDPTDDGLLTRLLALNLKRTTPEEE